MGIALSTGRTGPRRTQVRAALVLALGLVAAIALTQPTFTPAHAAAADLTIAVTHPGSDRLATDEPVPFTVTVTNRGDAAAEGGTFNVNPFGLAVNSAPDGCTTATDPNGGGHILTDCPVGALAAGASKTFPINGTTGIIGTRTQTARVTQPGDADTTNNSFSREITFFDNVDLSTSIAHRDGNGGNLRAGDPVTIRVNVTNHGPDSATDVVADVGIPSWRSTSRDGRCNSAYVCSLGTMSDNESAELVFRGSFEPGRAQITSKVRDGSTLTDDTGGPNDSDSLTLAVDPAPKAPHDGDGGNDGDGNGGGGGGGGDGDSTGGSGETSADNGSRGGATNPVELPSVTGGLAAPPALTGVGLGLPTVGNGVDLPMVGPNPAAPAGKGGPRADGADGTAKIVPPAILLALLMLLAWVALPALPSRRVRIRRR